MMKYLKGTTLIITMMLLNVASSTSFADIITTPATQPADQAAQKPEEKLEDRVMVARVVWVKGMFTASMPGSTEKRELKTASYVYMNDTLKTGADSEGQIVFTDNSNMGFRPNTELYINQYNYDPKAKEAAKSKGSYVMDLITGGFRTITGMVAKDNPDEYKVNTPVATIGVRGTEFSVVYEKDKGIFVKRIKGKPCVKNNGKGSTELCLDAKNKYAQVENADSAPKVLVQDPDVFSVEVEIIPVAFAYILNNGGGGDAGGGGGGFCIQ